jgi:spore coat protein U-like protein
MNSLLKYNLYSDSTHMTIWGDGTGGSSTVTGTNGHTTNNFTVYGQIPTPQGIAPNNYSDSITVTVTY